MQSWYAQLTPPFSKSNFEGILYLRGRGIPVDRQKAMTHFQIAADAGQKYAQYNLGAPSTLLPFTCGSNRFD